MKTTNKMKKESKKSQITIFVIFALIIVVGVILAVTILRGPSSRVTAIGDPHAYVQNCIKENLAVIESEIIEGNLYRNVTDNYILYENKKIKYLCKTSQFYMPCVNQEPMLVEHVKREISSYMEPKTKECFALLVSAVKRAGYEVEEGNLSMSIEFSKSSVKENVNKKVILKKANDIKVFNDFSAEILSPIYLLADNARSILNYESALCEFNNVRWMLYYKDVDVKRFVTSDQSKIYTVSDKTSQKKFIFAVKSCTLPAGI